MFSKSDYTFQWSLDLSKYFILVLICASCKSTYRQSCETINWREEGEKAALNGQIRYTKFDELKDQCSLYKTPVGETAFDEGYNRGLMKFCTVSNGYDYGEKGSNYESICPTLREMTFLKGYYKGRQVYLEDELKKIKVLHAEAKERLWRKEREYSTLLSEDPEMAKVEVSVVDAYKEELNKLSKKESEYEDKVQLVKRKSEEMHFN